MTMGLFRQGKNERLCARVALPCGRYKSNEGQPRQCRSIRTERFARVPRLRAASVMLDTGEFLSSEPKPASGSQNYIIAVKRDGLDVAPPAQSQTPLPKRLSRGRKPRREALDMIATKPARSLSSDAHADHWRDPWLAAGKDGE